MPRRLAIPRGLRIHGKRWRSPSRMVYPGEDSDDIPVPREDAGITEYPWEWLGGNRAWGAR